MLRIIGLVSLICLRFHGSLASNSEENALDLSLGEDECSMMVCRAGRECKVGADGEAACACLASCPDHFVPVCGSNNQSYDNFCLMHRDACLTGVHISLKKKGYCSNKSIKKKSSKKDNIKEENHFEPVVCFQWERDALRRQIINYFRHHTADQSWYRPDLKSYEKQFARFFMCDTTKDNFVDANELAACVTEVPFALRTTTATNELVKVLCVDAIIDSADTNSDWRMDFEEYKTLMDSSFQPKEKLCSLEGKKYEDGSQTKVDCNDCVCACGSWVCSSKKCDEELNEIDDVDEDEDLEDELDEDEDKSEDLTSTKDEVKILKIEEDIDLKIDDPDEDQPPKINSDDDDDMDDEDDEEDDDEDYDDEIDVKPIKKSKNKKKKST
ncbi:follistatin-related protein 1 [Daphnia magna]|nr:follistatin-related protein 1 [Daphnia magna]